MGQVCAKHQEFYETECRYCEPAAAAVCDHRKPGYCAVCKYDILPVAPQVPRFKQIPSMAELLGAEQIGPGESRFWTDFINTKYCKADEPAEGWPPGGVTGSPF